MHFSKLLPLAAFAAFASLATAQSDDNLAEFITKDGDTFGIPLASADTCINFEETGPKYTELFVDFADECFLYESRDCEGLIERFDKAQIYDITEYNFRSVKCYT
ncbi:hypothetical protein VE00_10083 [Pseudogymnoascus sp. WSF 3629]|nr:hypothetical protein VE00_10083 [Pseudogymnoascus sp. WSF 3629]